MQPLATDVELLLTQAKAAPEHRGLVRLRTMAVRCADEHGDLVFIGDWAAPTPNARSAAD